MSKIFQPRRQRSVGCSSGGQQKLKNIFKMWKVEERLGLRLLALKKRGLILSTIQRRDAVNHNVLCRHADRLWVFDSDQPLIVGGTNRGSRYFKEILWFYASFLHVSSLGFFQFTCRAHLQRRLVSRQPNLQQYPSFARKAKVISVNDASPPIPVSSSIIPFDH